MNVDTEPGPYSRLYWRFIDEYPDVYSDDKLFAWWMRLLVIADGSHPTSGSLPRRITDATLNKLVSLGLVTRIGDNNFRIKGVEGERARRKIEQRNGGIVRAETGVRGPDGRWVATSGGPAVDTSGGIQQSSNSRDETRRVETRQDETSNALVDDDVEGPALSWLAQHRAFLRPNGGKLHNDLTRLVEKHGSDFVIEEMAKLGEGLEPGQYVYGASNALNVIPKSLTREEIKQAERDALVREWKGVA